MGGGKFVELWGINTKLLSQEGQKRLCKIKTSQSIGVHVRRGDLATYNSTYGSPVSNEYIKEGIDYFICERESPVFYFFSDDIQFVKEDLIPSLNLKFNYEVIESDQDEVYEDFVLLSYCKDLIASKGTMAKYAALYGNAKAIVISGEDRQKHIIENISCNKIMI